MDHRVGIAIVLPALPRRDLRLTADVPRYVAWKDMPQQVVEVCVNDHRVDTWLFGEAAPAGSQRVTIIPKAAVDDVYMQVSLAVHHQAKLSFLSNVHDERMVGIGVERMVIEPYDPMVVEGR